MAALLPAHAGADEPGTGDGARMGARHRNRPWVLAALAVRGRPPRRRRRRCRCCRCPGAGLAGWPHWRSAISPLAALLAGSDPERAVDAFTEARRIYARHAGRAGSHGAMSICNWPPWRCPAGQTDRCDCLCRPRHAGGPRGENAAPSGHADADQGRGAGAAGRNRRCGSAAARQSGLGALWLWPRICGQGPDARHCIRGAPVDAR